MLPGQLSLFRQILRNFKCSQVFAFFISQGKIFDVNEPALHIDPERTTFILPIFKIFQDLLNHVNTGGRMAQSYIAAKNCPVAIEDTFPALREILDFVVTIHESQVNGKGIQTSQ